MTLKNNIEAIIIKWAYQIDEVLSKDSDEELNVPDEFPGPMVEVQFWKAKCMNLESLYEQIKAPTTRKMASILALTDSAYYPVFKSMFRNVVAALNEALDITLFLTPLSNHFEVLIQDIICCAIRLVFPTKAFSFFSTRPWSPLSFQTSCLYLDP